MNKILLVLTLTLGTLVSNAQTYSVIRKTTLFESNGTKKQIIGEVLKEQINPFYGLSKVWPKKYKATLTITDTLAIFEDSEMKLELIIKSKETISGYQSFICKDVEGNDYTYQVLPGQIILIYEGSDKLSDNVIMKQIMYSIK
jgi:hypothetical protein